MCSPSRGVIEKRGVCIMSSRERISHHVNAESLKCLDCICGIKTPDGIWCVKIRKAPSAELAKKCKYFLSKNSFDI
jgi:hypothetical protein